MSAFNTSQHVAAQRVVYHSPPIEPAERLPVGNGELGALLWTTPSGFVLSVSHSGIFDDRPGDGFDAWAIGEEENWTAPRAAGQIRVDLGLPVFDPWYLEDFDGGLDLLHAEARCEARGPLGEVACEAFVSQPRQVGVLRCRGTLTEPVAGRVSLQRWGSRTFSHWYSVVRGDPSRGLSGTEAHHEDGLLWIEQTLREMRCVFAARLEPMAGKVEVDHSRAVSVRGDRDARVDWTLHYTVVTSEQADDPLVEARRRLDASVAKGGEAIRQDHVRDWERFWSRSYIKLSQSYLENLWYVTLYLIASCSRGMYPAHFVDALWPLNRDFRAWTHYYHWNQQAMYWFLGPAGHSDLEETYLKWRARCLGQAAAYARSLGRPRGAAYIDVANRRGAQDARPHMALNRAPGLHVAMDFWRHYLFTGDLDLLREHGWPLMKAVADYELDLLEPGEDGRLHIPPGTPYEDEIPAFVARDVITELAGLQALFGVMPLAAAAVGRPAEAAPYEQARARLVDYTFMPLPDIYRDPDDPTRFNRRWSTISDYPIGGDYGAAAFAKRSDDRIDHDRVLAIGRLESEGGRLFGWRDTTRPACGLYLFRGTQESPVFPAGMVGLKDRGSEVFKACVTAARGNWTPAHGHAIQPIVFARLGLGAELAQCLLDFPSLYQHLPQGMCNYAARGATLDPRHRPDPHYHVRDARRPDRGRTRHILARPFAHTGFDAAGVFGTAVMEMLVQSHEGAVRLFPAMPEGWSGAFRLRARGGFWVEASRDRDGHVASVVVQSERGGELRLVLPWPARQVACGPVDGDEVPQIYSVRDGEVVVPTHAGMQYRIEPLPAEGVAPDPAPPSPRYVRWWRPKRHGRACLGKRRDF